MSTPAAPPSLFTGASAAAVSAAGAIPPATDPTPTLTLEQKIDAAATQAGQIVSVFSPKAAALIEAGVEVEPIISGFVQMFIAIFKHHAKKAVAGS
jgi:hypothetical protein